MLFVICNFSPLLSISKVHLSIAALYFHLITGQRNWRETANLHLDNSKWDWFNWHQRGIPKTLQSWSQNENWGYSRFFILCKTFANTCNYM